MSLTDKQIDALDYLVEATGYCSDNLGVSGTREFARAIESATLEALSGQAVAWAVEYGAVSLPHGDPSRITVWQVHATKEIAEASAKAMDFDSRIYPIPAQPPAQQEPFGYFKATPFGWTDCASTDEGAVALYERP